MDPNDNNNQNGLENFDKLIKEKLQMDIDLHASEIERSKPFVWSEVQRKSTKHYSLTWQHLAAAVILLLMIFSFTLYMIQNNHESELLQVTSRIETMQDYYTKQEVTLSEKEEKIRILSNQVSDLQGQMNSMLSNTKTVEKMEVEKVIYRTDTVYVSEIKYVTVPSAEPEILPDGSGQDPVQKSITSTNDNNAMEKDNEIFPSYSDQKSDQSTKTLQVKFGAFASNKTN